MTPDNFMAIARMMHSAEQTSHVDVVDFRVKGRIFASVREMDSRAAVKLTVEQQREVVETWPEAFAAAKGLWGQQGWTLVTLEQADEQTIRDVLRVAWHNVAPRRPAR
jgi:hypothetical protein